jgi:GNAT superfamily N-acetyltransferase
MIEEMESNENGFVALWTDKVEMECATLYANTVMNDDPFFNRLNVRCKESEMLERAEREFTQMRVKPFVHSLSNEKLKAELQKRGYVVYDTMSVLLHEGRYAIKHAPDISVERATSDRVGEWADVFCAAFDAEGWKDEVWRRVHDAFDRMQLFVAYLRNSPVGCTALFESNSLLGLYCLGTLERYRGRGIATALLSVAAEIAKENDLKLFLQSFRSEGFVNYYVKRGFTQIYTKDIFTKVTTSV